MATSSKQDLVRLARLAGVATSIPIVLVGGPVLGMMAGQFCDKRLSSDPWGVVVGVVIGLVAGLVETVRLVQLIQRLSNSSTDESS